MLFAVWGLSVGCTNKGSVEIGERPVVELRGAGSTFAQPIITRWAEEYQKQHPEVLIRYEGVGSGEGENRFLAEEADFGGTDAGLTVDQLGSIARGGVQVPITAGIIVLAYNPEGLPAELNIPREVYADVFLGKDIRWNDPRLAAANVGQQLPEKPIAAVVRRDRSGTTYAFTNHLAAISEEWRERFANPQSTASDELGVKQVDWPAGPLEASGNSGVAGLVKSTPYSLGYVQYGVARNLRLPMAALQNKAGNYIQAAGTSGLETLLNAELPPSMLGYFPDPAGEYSYPIVTFTWLLVYQQYSDEQKSREVNRFVQWCLTRGQDYSEEAGNVRLAPHIIRAAQKALAAEPVSDEQL